MKKIAVIMGSKSDYEVAKESIQILEAFDIPYTKEVISAHRTPKRLYDFAERAYQDNYRVIIAAAGGSAHLPGMLASLTSIPVIGLPILTKTLSGIDSLYSIVQMPAGIPVATVAINGGKNAGILAVEMLAINDEELYKKLQKFKYDMLLSVENEHNRAICD